MMNLFLVCAALLAGPGSDTVGQPVDIAPSAYQYRADRRADANPPESWLALIHYAHLPLNQPMDRNNAEIKHALSALLWEEIRPVQVLELHWTSGSRRIPAPNDVTITALVNRGASSSWWNNLDAIRLAVTPSVSADGRTYTYELGQNTCGLVVGVTSGDAAGFAAPTARVLVPDHWKKMDLEVEWGFDNGTSDKDYSGRVETYDGRISSLEPLSPDSQTDVSDRSWQSRGASSARRGVRLSLLYMGTSKWRKQQQYTSQRDDVARSIVTIWTKSGSFSFRAADLENGPILAPEHGFFVRRTSPLPPPDPGTKPMAVTPTVLSTKMDAIAGDAGIQGWGTSETPWAGANMTNEARNALGIEFPAKTFAMHPGEYVDAVAEWRSPISGTVSVIQHIQHAQAGGKGVEWWLARDSQAGREILASGRTDGSTSSAAQGKSGRPIQVAAGDRILLIVGPKGDHRSCTILPNLTISEVGGQSRSWNPSLDCASSIAAENPHSDRFGNPAVWRFCSESPMFAGPYLPSEPPFSLASDATSARAFERELAGKGLKTIRERIREHPEQTWEQAVTTTRGTDLPPMPVPPAVNEPLMKVDVPSERMTAQWNLGVWHLLRHCEINPVTGKLWFNDYPYGILAAETYLVLSVLDQMGSHGSAQSGFDQWTMLPMQREHPVGQFSDGNGALTFAEGPPGAGGNMDGIHAFGPGSIGWALTQHYWMSGDKEWLKANEARIVANAEWMIRQRHTVWNMVPGGDRLWCKGLQPALQVTPDSGGLWMQFYECEAYYWASVSRLAETIAVVDPAEGAKLKVEAEAYRRDLRAAVDKSVTLSPVEAVRDGTYHSVVPFACYVRGLSTGAWGWQRDGSGTHVGPLYWDTVQTAAALISPAALLSPQDVRVQGYLDVLEDRLLLENQNVGNRDWFEAGWQYQGGLERTANMHLAADDIPVFIRSMLNCYAVDILPKNGYTFNEHAVHGPPDKIFEEAAFLERFRNMLVMEDGDNLWLARGTPREWLAQGKHISVSHAPSRFGDVGYEIESDADHGQIHATMSLPSRGTPKFILLRLRHPEAKRITKVIISGHPWRDFDPALEVVRLHGLSGEVKIEVQY